MNKKIDKFCKYCNSDRVYIDAVCEWSIDEQEWVLTDAYDHIEYCHECCSKTDVIEKEVIINE